MNITTDDIIQDYIMCTYVMSFSNTTCMYVCRSHSDMVCYVSFFCLGVI